VQGDVVVGRNGEKLKFSSADIAVAGGVLTAATSADGSAPQNIKVESFKQNAALRSSLPMAAFEELKTLRFEYGAAPADVISVSANVVGAAKIAGGAVKIYTKLGGVTLTGSFMELDDDFLESLGVDTTDTTGRRLLALGTGVAGTYGTDVKKAGWLTAGDEAERESAPAALVACPSQQRTPPCSPKCLPACASTRRFLETSPPCACLAPFSPPNPYSPSTSC
jgi:hypothetical protein